MDILTKLGIFKDHIPNSTSSNDTTPLLDTLLASAASTSPVLHLLLFVYKSFGFQTGLDPSVLLTLFGFGWGAQYLLLQAWSYTRSFIEKNFMCCVTVEGHDDLFRYMKVWLSAQSRLYTRTRFITAETSMRSLWDDEGEEEEESEKSLSWTEAGQDGEGSHQYLNFSNVEAQKKPRFSPGLGSTRFWHKGTYFRIYRNKTTSPNSCIMYPWTKDPEEISIYCYGRSLQPIKELMAEAKAYYYRDPDSKTRIHRPHQKGERRDTARWKSVTRRPVRPMQTVVLDSKEKHAVLSDMNEYLHPDTPRWYASRGIPLRRGYLFHGPPGTGKTSFSFAIAGVFGIDIYVVSLQDSNLSEEDLVTLFTDLPRRCIILLEDIDTAGLRRPETGKVTDTSDKAATKKEKKNKKEKKAEEVGEEKKAAEDTETEKEEDSDTDTAASSDSDDEVRKKKKKKKSGKRDKYGKLISSENISLSGLLNAIDGVASHEGRILIMTTNKPEVLDEALVRPGRVDMQVGFSNASSMQAEELFHRMYEDTSRRPPKKSKDANTSLNGSATRKVSAEKIALTNDTAATSAEELKKVAAEFGRLVPQEMFSPAEIQGFLLKRKKSPRKALEDAQGWIDAALKQKESKSKIVTVQ